MKKIFGNSNFNSPIHQKMNEIAENIFCTNEDSDQIPIVEESAKKLDSLSPYWLNYKLDDNGDPISWVIIVPTAKEIAREFLDKKITEKELLEKTVPQERYSALYLCSAITIPKYRNRGFATELLEEGINKISKTNDYMLFAWPYSEAGTKIVEKLSEKLKKVETRKGG